MAGAALHVWTSVRPPQEGPQHSGVWGSLLPPQFQRGTGQGPLIHLEQPKVCTPPLVSCLLNLLRADLLGDKKSRLGHQPSKLV